MNKADFFKNGSRWLRADFHLHTKSDSEFVKFDGTDVEFIEQYIAQMKRQNVSVGLITNHNKFNLQEFKALRKAAGSEGIYLLPGVEFSLQGGTKGVHILIAFDDDWIYNKEGQNYIQQFLDASFVGKVNYWCSPYANSNFTLEAVVQYLDQYKKDYFIVMAHVDDNNGLFTELEGRGLNEFVASKEFKRSVYALQKSRKYDNRAKVPHIALVEGSDNAGGGISAIGCGNEVNGVPQKTYVKLGDFNFAALKYALRDYGNRVSSNEYIAPYNSYIESLSFMGGKLDGQTIDFSPELNCFIGIRGSGKSTALELLRYALGISLSNASADIEYKNDLIDYMLGSGGKIILTVMGENNRRYRIEKIYKQKENIYDEEGNLCNVSIDSIFRMPIYFGQKDLSNKKASFEADLLQRLIGNRLSDIRKKIDLKKTEIESVILELRKLRNLKSEKETSEQVIRNVQHQLDVFKQQGVADKLAQQTQFDKDGVVLSKAKETIAAYVESLYNIVLDYQSFFDHPFSGSTQNETLFCHATSAFQTIKSSYALLQEVAKKAGDGAKEFDTVLTEFESKRGTMQEEFAKIKRELNSDTVRPDSYLKLNHDLEMARLRLAELEKQEGRRRNLEVALNGHLAELNNLWNEEFQVLNKEVDRINKAQDKLQIAISFKEQRGAFLAKLKSTFKGTGIKDASYQKMCDDFVDFIEMFRNWQHVRDLLSDVQYMEFSKRFKDNNVELLTYKVEDKVVINYNGKPLERHSLGQRASALILFLLAQKDNDVLIIDQPEDDLDNQTIYDEVIKQMVALKGQMQFIFATHNANIPVLGDSEKVSAFSYEDKTLISINAGTIDSPQIHESIVGIMEGGHDAFNKRNEIYKMWR